MVSQPEAASAASLVDQLWALGVKPGGVLVVHTSFRAARPVEAGCSECDQARTSV